MLVVEAVCTVAMVVPEERATSVKEVKVAVAQVRT